MHAPKAAVRIIIASTLLWAGFISVAAAYTLSGTIYGGSAAMVGATVTVTDAATAVQLGQATSDLNGHYSLVVGTGTVNLLVAPADLSRFQISKINGIQIAQTDVVHDIALVFSAAPWTGTLRGLGGVALPGQSVTLTDMNANQVARTQTDITGAFQLNAPPGQYRMYVNGSSGVVSICTNPQNATGCTNVTFPDGMPVNFTYSGSISIPDSGLAQDLQLPFVELKGRITDSNGVPVAGIAVSGAGSSNIGSAGLIPDTSTQAMITPTFTPRVTSDANGNFSIWLFHQTNASESYVITLTAPTTSEFSTTTFNAFQIGQAGVVQDFVIKRSNKWTGTLRGLGGVALAGQSVTLTDMNANQVARTQTDITGAFQRKCAPGSISDVCEWFIRRSVHMHESTERDGLHQRNVSGRHACQFYLLRQHKHSGQRSCPGSSAAFCRTQGADNG